jgi:hypothetical protein
MAGVMAHCSHSPAGAVRCRRESAAERRLLHFVQFLVNQHATNHEQQNA